MNDTTPTKTEHPTPEPPVPHLAWVTIGSCPRCGRLFTGAKAFDRHWLADYCVPPDRVGLVSKPIPGDSGIVAWTTGCHPVEE